ncbi:hypothetical protein Hanom_Chr01g00079341 [Helianthus anomalus]
MECALNGIKMGGSKLIANLARFAKENNNRIGGKKVEAEGKCMDHVFPAQENVIHKNSFINHGNGKLFSELFSNDKHSTDNNCTWRWSVVLTLRYRMKLQLSRISLVLLWSEGVRTLRL